MIASGNGAFEIPLEGLIIMISEEDQHPHDLHAIQVIDKAWLVSLRMVVEKNW